MAEREYDVIVIGAGPAGENVADRVVEGGLTVVIVEAELVGGDCGYYACIPSKALVRPLHALAAARDVEGAREATGESVDVAAVLRRRDRFVDDWRDDHAVEWLTSRGIALVRGQGRLSGVRRVSVTRSERRASGSARGGADASASASAGADASDTVTELVARHAVVVATGSDPAIPPVPGLVDARPWTSRDVTSARAAPRRLVVIGGGVVACEMTVAWRQLGTEQLTIIERGPRPLSNLEPFASAAVEASLKAMGVRVLTNASAQEVRRRTVTHAAGATASGASVGGSMTAGGQAAGRGEDRGEVDVLLESGEHVVADEVLVATGRQPRTQDIGLDTVGLKPGSWLDVDESLALTGPREASHGPGAASDHRKPVTSDDGESAASNHDGGPVASDGSGRWLYAVGDVNHRALLTHMGKYQGRICGDVIVARARGVTGAPDDRLDAPWSACTATAQACAIPQAIFTQPEVGTVGLTEAHARERGLDVRSIDYDVHAVSGAHLAADHYAGQARLVIDVRRRVIVGFTMTGLDATELLHAATIAIVGEVPLDRLWHAVPSFPTISEVWLRLLERARAEGLPVVAAPRVLRDQQAQHPAARAHS